MYSRSQEVREMCHFFQKSLTLATRYGASKFSITEKPSACAVPMAMATRSPAFSMAGPEVMRIFTPISLAITAASVVLPRPGGP